MRSSIRVNFPACLRHHEIQRISWIHRETQQLISRSNKQVLLWLGLRSIQIRRGTPLPCLVAGSKTVISTMVWSLRIRITHRVVSWVLYWIQSTCSAMDWAIPEWESQGSSPMTHLRLYLRLWREEKEGIMATFSDKAHLRMTKTTEHTTEGRKRLHT